MLKVNLKNIKLIDHNSVILKDVNFSLRQNEVLTILGKNGTGKTTFLNSLTALLNPDIYSVEGSVLFEGQELLTAPPKEIEQIRNRNIKYVFQDSLNCFDPLYKLKYYIDAFNIARDILTRTLLNFNMPTAGELSKYYPYELSGGMAQRFAIALAASADPDIILFDEPTSNLDYGSANTLRYFIKDFVSQKSKGVIIVSQDIDFALSISDRIFYIVENRLQELEKNLSKHDLEELFLNNAITSN